MPARRRWIYGIRIGVASIFFIELSRVVPDRPTWFSALVVVGFLIGDLVGVTLMCTGYLGISRARATLPNAPWNEVDKVFQHDLFRPGSTRRT
jgi:hypothetical protein